MFRLFFYGINRFICKYKLEDYIVKLRFSFNKNVFLKLNLNLNLITKPQIVNMF